METVRFIPAGAGNSIDCWVILENVAVYPRWRGELAALALLAVFLGGLSPLARGTRR